MLNRRGFIKGALAAAAAGAVTGTLFSDETRWTMRWHAMTFDFGHTPGLSVELEHPVHGRHRNAVRWRADWPGQRRLARRDLEEWAERVMKS